MVDRMTAVATLRTPLGRRAKVVEQGTGTPLVFLHSGVGSAGEWKQVFSLWPEGYRLVAIEVYRDGTGPGVAGRWSIDGARSRRGVVRSLRGVHRFL